MYRNLFVFIFILLSGCILYVDPWHSHSSGGIYSWDVWMEDPSIHCYYDAYWDLSEWYLEIYADSYYGPYEVAEVGYRINNYDYTSMEYVGDGFWVSSFFSNYYDCDRSLHFDFIAIDYDGYKGFYTSYW